MEKTFEEKINGYYFQFWLWSVIAVSLLIIVIGIIPAFVAMVFECFLLYHAWKAIPNNPWKVPPILAVILLFVPVAGTIWMFWAYYFMSQEMNRELTQKGDSYRTNGEVIMAACVLTCVTVVFLSIPTPPTIIIGWILMIPTGIVSIFAMRSIKDGILALHRHEEAPEAQP
jgi:divalent metal cation (Fe/Co/Zn/Cd) transporter